MKNLIDPKILAELKKETVTMEEIVNFLDNNPNITVTQLATLINVDRKKIYSYRRNKDRKNTRVGSQSGSLKVIPKAASKRYNRYSAEDKYILVQEYSKASDEGKSELLRRYGLYSSDICRWEDQIKQVSLEALGKRKIRSDKKTEEQIKIEELEKDLAEQEKTTAKLSTLLFYQKKTFDMLKKRD